VVAVVLKEQEQIMEVLVVELLLVFQIVEVQETHLLQIRLKVMMVEMVHQDLQDMEGQVVVELRLLEQMVHQVLVEMVEQEHQII
jgi:hypothetical protein|tara:strand:- start:203 stop:457 length:255 start_codon:yes stop_codon:yes gene_type:complete